MKKTFIRINYKDGMSNTTVVTSKGELDELIVLSQQFGWTLDIIGRRPW